MAGKSCDMSIFKDEALKKIGIDVNDIEYINELARQAGYKAKEIYQNGILNIETKDNQYDLVTVADIELSQFILKTLKERFTGDVVISEEEPLPSELVTHNRVWVVDPIDGTDNYIRNDGWYSIMIGIIKNNKPVAGWVYAPVEDRLILGIPDSGLYEKCGTFEMHEIEIKEHNMKPDVPLRVMMGRRDRRLNPDITEKLSKLNFVEMGSLGLKVFMIIDGMADIFIHICKKIKLWDTVAPSAIAIAAGLKISTLEGDQFEFNLNEIHHRQTFTVGVSGAREIILSILKD
jgi:3'(2'), 5'-bisphosphate nucleotidase